MTKKQEQGGAWLDIDKLKKQTSIRDVLEGYGLLSTLEQRGSTLVGPSPFHEADDRSFRVDLDRQIWNDFQGRPEGCKGNVVGLVQALEPCTFRQALEIVATRFAVIEETRERITATGQRKHETDTDAPVFGKELRGLRFDLPFLEERGISAKVAESYGVGYCSRGLFKGRLVAPVKTIDGTVAGYVGRAIKPCPPDERWKNPSGFQRSQHLFGLHHALDTSAGKKAIQDYGLVVVQSPLDVLKLTTANCRNAVAQMSPTLSSAQTELLTDNEINPTRRITLLMNNDKAGQAGKREAATMLIHRAFVRYAAWHLLDGGETSPDQLDATQIRKILRLH